MRRKWLLRIVTALFGVVLMLTACNYALPELSNRALVALLRHSAGLSQQWVKAGDLRIEYLNGGTGPTLVLLHGFAGQKESWIEVARHLAPHLHVIAPDLPCFGQSARLPVSRCTIAEQVGHLDALLNALKIKEAHLGGNSMGGWIAAAYAAQHSERVKSLWLLAPAGVASAEASEYLRGLDSGLNLLVPTDAKGVREMLAFVVARPRPIPHAVEAVLTKSLLERQDYHRAIFDQLRSAPPIESFAEKINAPTMIVWGLNDRVLDNSGAAVLGKYWPHATVELEHGVGHLPMIEAPETVARRYQEFLAAPPGPATVMP